MNPASTTSADLLLQGDYEYLGEGYYACQDAEARGDDPAPTCADALDAYIVPLALERARLTGLPVPQWSLTNEHFTPPAVLYGINPFARNHLVVEEAEQHVDAARKISRNGKFVICCQQLPPQARLVSFELVLGRSADARFDDWAAALFDLFRLPLALVRLIETPEGHFLSALERLPRAKLSPSGAALLDEQLRGQARRHE